MTRVVILDVGHGNGAVLLDDDGVVVIDGGSGRTLLGFLEASGIFRVDQILISHADEDHIGGIVNLVLDERVSVGAVYMNPDPNRRTKAWEDLLIALGVAMEQGRLGERDVFANLSASSTAALTRKTVGVQVLAPSALRAAAGVGGPDLGQGEANANSMSAVVRVVGESGLSVLFTGDMDAAALDSILGMGVDMRSTVLVYPHHGGMAGNGNPREFTTTLCSEVQPDLVVFSTGRGRWDNPAPEVIDGVMQASDDAYIACTQLSRTCADAVPDLEPTHLSCEHARGRCDRKCCAGTIQLDLGTDVLTCIPDREAHTAFIQACAPAALCLR